MIKRKFNNVDTRPHPARRGRLEGRQQPRQGNYSAQVKYEGPTKKIVNIVTSTNNTKMWLKLLYHSSMCRVWVASMKE
jgi:hypothetical protein